MNATAKTVSPTSTVTAVKPKAPAKVTSPATSPVTSPVTKPKVTKVKPKKNAVKGKVGRPKANLKLILNKTFSMAEVIKLNPDKNKLTVRRRIMDGFKSGIFTKLAKKVLTGKRGKPADLFINTKVLAANRANLSRVKAKADAVVAVYGLDLAVA